MVIDLPPTSLRKLHKDKRTILREKIKGGAKWSLIIIIAFYLLFDGAVVLAAMLGHSGVHYYAPLHWPLRVLGLM